MADMRKLMEAVNSQINEGWDPGAIADAIYAEYTTEGSPLQAATTGSENFYKDLIYAYADGTGLFNPRAIEGSEIWYSIIDSLEDNFWQNVSSDDIRRAQMGEDADDGDVESKNRSDEEFMHDVIKLCDEGEEALMDDGMSPMDQLEVLAQVLQDISNIARLRASGRPYAPIHEGVFNKSPRQATIKVHKMMDEQMLDPRTVADAALTYMSEAEVADMAHTNEWFYDDEDEEGY